MKKALSICQQTRKQILTSAASASFSPRIFYSLNEIHLSRHLSSSSSDPHPISEDANRRAPSRSSELPKPILTRVIPQASLAPPLNMAPSPSKAMPKSIAASSASHHEFEPDFDDLVPEDVVPSPSQPSSSLSSSSPSSFYASSFNGNNAPKPTMAFVSEHYRITEPEILGYLRRKGLEYRISGREINVKTCPNCHPTKGKLDNLYKLFIHRDTGTIFCHRCGVKGNFFELKRLMGDLSEDVLGQIQPKTNGSAGGASDVPSPAISVSAPIIAAPPAASKTSKTVKSSAAAAVAAPSSGPASSSSSSASDANAQREALWRNSEFSQIRNWLIKQRGITESIAKLYGVGAAMYKFQDESTLNWKERPCVTFPWTDFFPTNSSSSSSSSSVEPAQAAPAPALDEPDWSTIRTLRLKVRDVANKKNMRLDPAGGPWGLFGWHTVPSNAKHLVVTEGELDAMSVRQATGVPAVSLPNGCRSLPVDLLPQLERFERIYLWMDDDGPGQEGALQFANKLGIGRCFIVHTRDAALNNSAVKYTAATAEIKDANDALRAGLDLKKCLDASRPLPHTQILTFKDLRDDVFRELADPKRYSGVPCTSLPKLTRILKGHRAGELTVFTGPTGVGKTTVLSQISLDFAAQGINTLWGSFEIKNSRLARKMLTQYAGRSLEGAEHVREFPMWASKFEALPLWFMRFFGSTDVDRVIDAMDYASYVHDVRHVVLDNLQFMTSGQGKGYERLELQDLALEKFRQFATARNVHVSVVIHPRKEDDEQLLGISSVFGSAKATQEADNVLIIQKGPKYRFLEVKKNRFDGELGKIPFKFDKPTSKIVELTDEELNKAMS